MSGNKVMENDVAESNLDNIIKKYEEEMLIATSPKRKKECRKLIRAAYMAKDVMDALRGNGTNEQ